MLFHDLINKEILKLVQDDSNARICILKDGERKYVWKKYTPQSLDSFELERKNVGLLKNSGIRMCRSFAIFHEELSIFYEIMDGNFSEYCFSILDETEKLSDSFISLIDCIKIEIEGLRNLNLKQFSRNGDYAYTYQRNLDVLGIIGKSALKRLKHTAKLSNFSRIVTRYDPDIFNFLVKDGVIYSHDFSLWRTSHPIYYYSFFVTDLIKMAEIDKEYNKSDKKRFRILAEKADETFKEEILENKDFYFSNNEDPEETYLLNKLDAYSYYATWYLKRILAMDYDIHDRDTLKRNYKWSKEKILEVLVNEEND